MGLKHLVVHIDREAVRFQRLVDNEITEDHTFIFKDKTDFGYKDQLDVFLTKTDFRSMDWDEYSLSWFSEKSTLLPYSIFGTTDTTAAFRLSFGNSVQENDIDFNRIPEHMVVNLYEIPLWVKSFFIMRFPRMVIQHAGTHIIRGLFNGSTYGLKIVMIAHHDYFQLIAIKNNELKFYNVFDFQSAEDIYYHVAHLIQQQGFIGEKGTFCISEPITDSKWYEFLQKDWEKIDLFKNIKLVDEPKMMTQYQQFCV